MARLPVVLLCFLCCGVAAAVHLVTTGRGDDIPVRIHAADGDRLILWLPSEFGVSPRRVALAEALAARGIEVWAPDLHATWFLPVGRYSLNEVDPAAVSQVISAAIAHGAKSVYLMAEGRSVALALASVRHWQQTTDSTASLAGLLAFGPRLYVRTPQGGEAAEYLPIAGASNLPIYILQPEDSSGFWRIGDDVRELEKGGSPVFVQRLPKVSDGFYAREVSSPAEDAMTRRLPGILQQAMNQLQAYNGTPAQPATLRGRQRPPEKPVGSALLRPYPAEREAPALRLQSLRGDTVDLINLRRKVVLINYWTTWCPPCVEEIPSLQRLHTQLQADGLEILAVDVGESAQTLESFLRDKPIRFPVLLDSDGDALRDWGIYAFPTTLVLDRRHRIRYAVFGAFDWTSPEVLSTLRTLLAED
ncbi:MAG: TlpA disulfide reductase family protein [Sedimenticolaceae bacterium]